LRDDRGRRWRLHGRRSRTHALLRLRANDPRRTLGHARDRHGHHARLGRLHADAALRRSPQVQGDQPARLRVQWARCRRMGPCKSHLRCVGARRRSAGADGSDAREESLRDPAHEVRAEQGGRRPPRPGDGLRGPGRPGCRDGGERRRAASGRTSADRRVSAVESVAEPTRSRRDFTARSRAAGSPRAAFKPEGDHP